MKRISKFFVTAISLILICIMLAGCGGSEGVIVPEDEEITLFPHVTEDGRAQYQLIIDEHLIKTKAYPFRLTTDSILLNKREIIEESITSVEDMIDALLIQEKKQAEKSEKKLSKNVIDIREFDDYASFFPIFEVLEYLNIDYITDDDNATLTARLPFDTLYIKGDKPVVFYNGKLVRITPPVYIDGVLYASKNFFNYFFDMESGITFEKDALTLTTIIIPEETTSEIVECPYCKGLQYVDCKECGGTGIEKQYTDLYDVDTNFSWEGSSTNERRCMHCNGTGHEKCSICDGVGVITWQQFAVLIKEDEKNGTNYTGMAGSKNEPVKQETSAPEKETRPSETKITEETSETESTEK